MLSLPRLVPVFSKRPQKMWFEVHPSFLRLVCSVPFTAVHRVETGAFYQVFGDGHNLDVYVGVLKGRVFLAEDGSTNASMLAEMTQDHSHALANLATAT